MRNVVKLLCKIASCFVAINANAWEIIGGELRIYENDVYDQEIHIDSESSYTSIVNHGKITKPITIDSGVVFAITNYGEIESAVSCGTCVAVQQIIPDGDAINIIPGLAGHEVVVENGATNIHLADVIAIAGDAETIIVRNIDMIVDFGITDVHPKINVDSTNGVSFEVWGLPDGWNSTEPLLTNINNGDGTVVTVDGVDKFYIASGYIENQALYVQLSRRTDYSVVMENEMGNWLDELRVENPNDKLLGALDGAWTRSEMNGMLAQSVRTNPIKLMEPARIMNSFMLGESFHDLDFGIVAEPFYIYSGDFSILGGGVSVSGNVTKNLTAKFGGYVGKIDYDNYLDSFDGMVYGANVGAVYKDTDFYARAVGTFASAGFRDITVFDGTRGAQNPNGISGAAVVDGGVVFNVFGGFDVVPFVGARFDYAHVLNSSDTDTNLRFGLNVDKDTVVDGNKYAFGLHTFAQTNGEIYAGIYTDMMSVVDGVGGRLDLGLLHDDDFGMSYRIKFDVKFDF